MKRRKFSFKKTALFFIVLVVFIAALLVGFYKFSISSFNSDTKAIIVEVEKGDNYFTMANKLKSKKLIKSEFFYKIFLKLHKPGELVPGRYELNKSMDVHKIVDVLGDEKNILKDITKLTFREGLNAREIAKVIESNTDISADEFLSKISDENYINTLIDKYWFLTDEIKNKDIYYDLEGYLYPDTYNFEKNELVLEKIIETILNNTEKKLVEYRNEIEKSKYTVHNILTLASLVELEASSAEDREVVAGVFYNRLNNKWALGSDVTTYYAAKKAMTESLTKAELDECNGYNTRCARMQGLPVGPIDNPSITAIKAAINPADTDYYYFVADSSKKVYFTKNANEHAAIIAKLKKEGKWIG